MRMDDVDDDAPDFWDDVEELGETDICPVCNGSGEGQYDGSTCGKCKGHGEVPCGD